MEPKRRRVCVVITARPSFSRVKSLLTAIQDHPLLELQLVVGGSALLHNYGAAIRYIREAGFAPVAEVYTVIEGENLLTSAKTTGLAIVELPSVFDRLKPDVVVTVADRYETLATAVSAAYMNIPLAHIQGGEVTGSIDEKVRHAVTKLSDLHFVATEQAAERVIRMGENPEAVFVCGCPSIDLAASILEKPELDFDPFLKYGGVGPTFDMSDGYLVVMQHPVTTEHAQAGLQVTETLMAVQDLGYPALWFWPNVDAGSDGISKTLRSYREYAPGANLHFFTGIGPEDFLRLAYHAQCVVGNSSVGIRESSYLGVPVVNIGSRQAGRERAENVVDVGYDREEIKAAIRQQIAHGRYPQSHIYGDGKAGSRIADLLTRCELHIEKKLCY
jgi:UDP-hydrolysing UDP-N-acetyl-D-glucosamine 2-epimerase